ncbi:hypothetical protein DFH08DRAFT_820090 [Mycena albidolilacea]|uniref:Uncharacterized protein n=1 Tax=Mycena albidolilacea TaxID=1033008 RepID=A0AAD6ZCR9_9AGAR|nr:hypothetical protein DFH08DRAFT_820090 [Mycena albidolilacea]
MELQAPVQVMPMKQVVNHTKNTIDDHITVMVRPDCPGINPSDWVWLTPGRIAVGSTLNKAIQDSANMASASPPDPSDDPSSSGSDGPKLGSNEGLSDTSRHTSAVARHQKMSSNRSTGTRSRMILKPIPPMKYNGEMNAPAFQRFVCKGSAYVKMGWVPVEDQVFYVSYYLKEKAADYYNQVVVLDEESYTLEKFSVGLFDFIFLPDFCNTQQKKLNCCFQNE